jgi:nicotinic acid mononucleotide adenylyltransferase
MEAKVVSTLLRKAFYIISHYRQRWCWFVRSEAENNVWRWQFAYNVDYVICCGIKALEKLRTSVGGKCLFLAVGRDNYSKCKRWTFWALILSDGTD